MQNPIQAYAAGYLADQIHFKCEALPEGCVHGIPIGIALK
jgi:hypothetical protein